MDQTREHRTPERDDGFDVYIVHAPADLERALELARRLTGDGFEVALEAWEILPGDVGVHKIEEIIQRAAAGVVLYSRVVTGDPWVAEKYAALIRRSVETGQAFVPVLLDDTELPLFAASRPPVDLRGADWTAAYRRLVEALRAEHVRQHGSVLPNYRDLRPEGSREVLLRIDSGEVTFVPSGSAPPVTHVPRGLMLSLDNQIWRLEQARRGITFAKNLNRGNDRADQLEMLLKAIGQELGNVFLDGSAGRALAGIIDLARRQNSTVRLGLEVSDHLADLPWETLTLPGHGQPLALDRNVDLYRCVQSDAELPAITIRAPLRILAMVASPDGPGGGPLLDLEAELQRILDAVEPARRYGAAYVRILNQGTLQEVRDALIEERFHALHFSCHAVPGALLLEDQDGHTDKVTAQRLLSVIPPDRGVPLITLSGCSTAVTARVETTQPTAGQASDSLAETGEGALAGMARSLSEAGVPAVLAMTAPITDRYATLLAGAVYRELALSPQPEVLAAVSSARRALEYQRSTGPERQHETKLVEWATPALFLRGTSIPLYDVTAGVETNLSVTPPISFAPGVPVRAVGDFIGRRSEIRDLLKAFREGRPGVLLHGIGGVGKSTLAAELLGRLGPDAGIVVSAIGRTSPEELLGAVAQRTHISTATSGHSAEPIRRLVGFLRDQSIPWALRLEALAGNVPVTLLLDNFETNLTVGGGDAAISDHELAEFLATWVNATGNLRLLITSRYPFRLPGDAHDRLHVHHLGPLSWAESRKLIWRLPGVSALSFADQYRAFTDVGGHPRTLEYLDALLRGGKGRFTDITRRIERLLSDRGIRDVGSWCTSLDGSLDRALAETITLAVDDTLLAQLISLLDVFARRLLVGASVYRLPVERAGIAWSVSKARPPVDDRDRSDRMARYREMVKEARQANPDAMLEDLGLAENELTQAYADITHLSAPPIIIPDGLENGIATLTARGLLTPSVGDGDEDPLFIVHRWTATTLAKPELTEPEQLRAAHVAAADYWRYIFGLPSLSRQASVSVLMEARYHEHSAGRIDRARSATGLLVSELHAMGAWNWEEQVCQETLGWLPEDSEGASFFTERLGVIARARGDYDKAVQFYDRSRAIAQRIGDQRGLGSSLTNLGIISFERGDFEEATDYHEQALSIAREQNLISFEAASLHELSMIATGKGEYEQAEALERQSLRIRQEIGETEGMGDGLSHLGVIAFERGDYNSALDYQQRALALMQEVGDRAKEALCFHELGLVEAAKGDFARAINFTRRSADIKQELGNRAGAALDIHQLGVIAALLGDLDQAYGYATEAYNVFIELRDKRSAALSLLQLGYISGERGEGAEALEYISKALQIKQEIGDRPGIASCLAMASSIYFVAGHAAEAVKYTIQSLAINAELGSQRVYDDFLQLQRQRELLQPAAFNRLLAEHLDEQSLAAVIAQIDSLPTTPSEDRE